MEEYRQEPRVRIRSLGSFFFFFLFLFTGEVARPGQGRGVPATSGVLLAPCCPLAPSGAPRARAAECRAPETADADSSSFFFLSACRRRKEVLSPWTVVRYVHLALPSPVWCRSSVPRKAAFCCIPTFVSQGPALWWSAAVRAVAIDCCSRLSMARSGHPRRRWAALSCPLAITSSADDTKKEGTGERKGCVCGGYGGCGRWLRKW